MSRTRKPRDGATGEAPPEGAASAPAGPPEGIAPPVTFPPDSTSPPLELDGARYDQGENPLSPPDFTAPAGGGVEARRRRPYRKRKATEPEQPKPLDPAAVASLRGPLILTFTMGFAGVGSLRKRPDVWALPSAHAELLADAWAPALAPYISSGSPFILAGLLLVGAVGERIAREQGTELALLPATDSKPLPTKLADFPPDEQKSEADRYADGLRMQGM